MPTHEPSSTAPPPVLSGSRSAGFTLLELAVVLSLLGLLLGMSLPLGRGLLDRWATRAVRDDALAALHRVRVEARVRGGASLAIDGRVGVLVAGTGDSVLWVRREPRDAGVVITRPDGTRLVDTLRFDALGLGVVASRTVVFRRGRSEARLVISSRGRGSRR